MAFHCLLGVVCGPLVTVAGVHLGFYKSWPPVLRISSWVICGFYEAQMIGHRIPSGGVLSDHQVIKWAGPAWLIITWKWYLVRELKQLVWIRSHTSNVPLPSHWWQIDYDGSFPLGKVTNLPSLESVLFFLPYFCQHYHPWILFTVFTV